MLHIAGGIILAIIILSLLPYTGYLLVAAFAVAACLLLLFTETGRALGVVGLALFAGIWLLGKIFGGTTSFFSSLKKRAQEAGGWDISIGNFLFELRPAFSEAQKIQKIADRQLRAEDAAYLKSVRLERANEKLEAHQRSIAAAWENQRTKAFNSLSKNMRRLEKKFAAAAHLRFEYSDKIEIYTQYDDGSFEKIIQLGCFHRKSNLVRFRVQTARRYGHSDGTDFFALNPFTELIRKILRIVAAEKVLARNVKRDLAGN